MIKKHSMYLWVIRKIYTDGTEKNVEIEGDKYSAQEKGRIMKAIKDMFLNEKELMASYAFPVRKFPFGRFGICARDKVVYLNRAGLIF